MPSIKSRWRVSSRRWKTPARRISITAWIATSRISALSGGRAALKVEGRQRSPAYVAQVTRTLRAALDELGRGAEQFKVKPAWQAELGKVAEGTQVTLGAYNRPWR